MLSYHPPPQRWHCSWSWGPGHGTPPHTHPLGECEIPDSGVWTPYMLSIRWIYERMDEWLSPGQFQRHLRGLQVTQVILGQAQPAVTELSGSGMGRRWGAHQTGIPLPFQVACAQHVLSDGFLPSSPPIQAATGFRVNDGNLQLLQGLRVAQGYWE